MVENQHQKISGYRDLTEDEIALMNEIKAHERELAALHVRVVEVARKRQHGDMAQYDDGARQAAIAKTQFEHAFMRLVRAVANPATPWRG